MHDAPWEHHHEVGEHIAGRDDQVVWTTGGFDIGSSTAQVMFSKITLARRDAEYVVEERLVLHESKVILTPYLGSESIDGAALAEFIDGEYRKAGLARDEIDTGAVILTGLALRAGNARVVADAIADSSGRFVSVAAGDLLEARLAASGAGVPDLSRHVEGILAHIDIGGGTTKLSLWRNGSLEGVAAVDIGARLVTFGEDGAVRHVTPPGALHARALGIDIRAGQRLPTSEIEQLAGAMAHDALSYAGVLRERPRGPVVYRTAPLFKGNPPKVSAVIFSGGVSEYIYGRETKTFGDLGLALGRAVREAMRGLDIRIIPFERGIRATVLGVSQHTVQLSGSTVYVSDSRLLPLRNIPVVLPKLDVAPENLARAVLRQQIEQALVGIEPGRAVAIGLKWRGMATYQRLGELATAIIESVGPKIGAKDPLVVAVEGDVAGVLGRRLAELSGSSRGIICLDGIHLHEFDFVDIGEFATGTQALPVVVKSLLFSGLSERGHTHGGH